MTTKKQHIINQKVFVCLGFVVLIALFVLGLIFGASTINLSHLFTSIDQQSLHYSSDYQIITQIRLPRILAGMLAGMLLGISGAVIQSILRNPLASPLTIGISHAAAFGAGLGIILYSVAGIETTPDFLMGKIISTSLSAFLWSIVCVIAILAIAQTRALNPQIIILAGIIMGALFMAGTSAIQYFSDESQLAEIVYWMFGNLGKASWIEVAILFTISVPVTIYFFWKRWEFNALSFSDEMAASLGVSVKKTRLYALITASLATASTVAMFGIIGFVGLVVPHMIRNLVGANDRFLIPASALGGAIFLQAADILAHTLFRPIVLPVGIISSLIGAPLFLFILLSNKQNAS